MVLFYHLGRKCTQCFIKGGIHRTYAAPSAVSRQWTPCSAVSSTHAPNSFGGVLAKSEVEESSSYDSHKGGVESSNTPAVSQKSRKTGTFSPVFKNGRDYMILKGVGIIIRRALRGLIQGELE